MKRRILISCGDDECIERFKKSFSDFELHYQSTDDEADLLLEILNRDYHAIIYDLGSSQRHGLKMIKILRKIRPKVPVVAITEPTSKEIGGRILQEGVAYYGVKPLDLETIRNAVYSSIKNII